MIPRSVQHAGLGAALALAAMAGGWVGWTFSRPPGPAHAAAHYSTALRIEQVRQLASLVSLEVPISDVQTTTLSGYTGGLSVVLLVKADVQIATDLNQARLEEVDAQGRCATLVLPQPRTQRPRLDHQGTRVYRLDRSGLWVLTPGAAGEAQVVSLAMKQAQELVEKAAGEARLIEQARAHATEVLGRFFAAMDWTVQVRWASPAPG